MRRRDPAPDARIRPLVTTAAAVALAAQVAVSIYALQPPPPAGSVLAAPASRAPAIALDTLLTQIRGSALFGDAAPAQPTVLEQESRYVLSGLFRATDAGWRFAIVMTPEGRSRLVREGDRLSDADVVEAIDDSGLILNAAGVRRRLGFQPKRDLFAAVADRRERVNLPAPPPAPVDPGPTLRALGLVNTGAGLSGPGPESWRAGGLRSSDLIVAINGQPIDRILSKPLGIDEFAMQAGVALTVMRGAQRLEIMAVQSRVPQASRAERLERLRNSRRPR